MPNTIDETTLQGGRVRLLQPKDGLRAGLDAVMLAAACPAEAGADVLDLGCGTGAAGLCVRARVDVALTGFDIQASLIALAAQSVTLNGWYAEFIVGDVRDKTALAPDAYDHVICNPPYLDAGSWHDTPDPVRSKQLGRQAGDASLADWLACMHRVVRPGGSVSLIYRADHMDKLIQVFGTRFGGTEIWPLYPRAGQDAKRVIIRAQKNRKTPARMHAGIVLHEDDGTWTQAASAILAEGCAL